MAELVLVAPEKWTVLMKRQISSTTQNEMREEALRPFPTLGYDHHSIAMHLLGRGAYALAQKEWVHAIWLNPFEPMFKTYLALCFYRQKKIVEARIWIAKALEQKPDDPEAKKIYEFIIKDPKEG